MLIETQSTDGASDPAESGNARSGARGPGLDAAAAIGASRPRPRTEVDPDEATLEQPGLSLVGLLGRTTGTRPQIRVCENAAHLEGASKRFLAMLFGIGFALALGLGILVGALLS